MQRIPSIWDYLGQGISQGTDAYKEQKDKQRAEKQQALQNQMNQLGFMSQLYQSGALPAASFEQSLNSSGIPGIGGLHVMPSKAERVNSLISGAPPEDQPDLNYEVAGLTNPKDTKTRRRTDTAKADVATTQAGGAALDLQLKQNEDLDKNLTRTAPRYVAQILAKNQGGRLDPTQLDQTAQLAYTSYMKDRQLAGTGVLKDPLGAQKYFHDAVSDAMHKQRDEEYKANISNGRVTEQDRQFQQLNTMHNNLLDQITKMENDQVLASYLTKPADQVPTFFKSRWDTYHQYKDKADRVYKAMGTLVPKEVAALLNQPEVKPPLAPPPGAAVKDMDAAELKKAINTTKSLGDANLQKEWIDRKLAKGEINAADRARILGSLGIKP